MCFLKSPSKWSLEKGRAEGGGWEGAGVRSRKGEGVGGDMKYYLKHIPRHNKVLR